MFFLIYKKYSLLSLQTRLLAGFSALIIILTVVAGLIFNFLLLDKISLYANNQTVLYFKLDLDRSGDYYQDKIISQILTDFDVADLDRHLLDKELAIICSSPQRHLRCQLLVKSSDPVEIQNLLEAKKIPFQRLHYGITAIGITEAPFKKTHNPLTYLKFQGLNFRKNLLITILPPTNLNSDLEKSLAFLSSPMKLYGQTGNNGLIINGQDFNFDKKIKDDYEFDLLVNVSSNKKNQATPLKYLVGGNDLNLLAELFIGENFSLAMNKKSDQGGILDVYDFFIRSDYKLQPSESLALEKLLISLAQYSQTQEKTIYLNDGTKVIILNKSQDLSFIDSGDSFRVLSLTNGQKIYYGYQNNNLIIGNNDNFQPISILPKENSLKIKLASLPKDNWLKKYLQDFSFLEVEDNQITLR